MFLGISVQDTDEEARKFVAANGFTFANGRDPDLKIAHAFRVEATPTTFLITPGGEILGRQNGGFPEEQLVAALQRLLDFKGP